jgi:hypothetical protein
MLVKSPMAKLHPSHDADRDLPKRPFIRAVEMEGAPGLGGKARLELTSDKTALVGKNGAGKSAVLAAISNCSSEALWPSLWRRLPGDIKYRCEVERPGAPPLAYEYARQILTVDEESLRTSTTEAGSGPETVWEERCVDLASNRIIWRVADAQILIGNDRPIAAQPGMGLLSAIFRDNASAPDEAKLITGILARVSLVPAGVPRGDQVQRADVLLSSVVRNGRRRWRVGRGGARRIAALAEWLANIHEVNASGFEEFAILANKLGIAKQVHVQKYNDPRDAVSEEERRDLATVDFDGINIGLLSDGTLRVAEILVDVLRPGGSLLLIEEPETAVHPGLLSRVLNLLDAYVADRQIVVSTHSPLVVDWCEPSQLRLVTREGNKTTTRSLSTTEAARVAAYLNDEGTLGDFVFTQSS